MGAKKIPLLPNPMRTATYFSKYFSYWWLNSLFTLGNKRPLRNEDLYDILPEDETKRITAKLERHWKEEKSKAQVAKRKPKFYKALTRYLGWDFMILGIYAFVEESLRMIQPYFIGKLVGYFVPGSSTTKLEAYIYATIIVVCTFIIALIHHPLFFKATRYGMHLRVACGTLVYRKAMILSHSAYSSVTTGHIINLVTSDVQILERVPLFLHQLWIAPLLLLTTAVFSWYELGPWCLPGIILLSLLAPFQGWMGKQFAILRHKTALLTDKRFRIMNEVISGMRVIKMYTWEIPFSKLVTDVRRQEIDVIKKSANLRSLNGTLYMMCIPLAGLAMFIPYVLTGHTLSPEKVYTVLGLFFSIRVGLTIFLPECVRGIKEGMVSSKRIQNFLQREDKHNVEGIRKLRVLTLQDESPNVKVNNITAKWSEMLNTPTLKDIDFELKPGDLFMVIGPVGAGKSSLLMSLLGELPVTRGTINVQGKVSYASQQVWVFSGSIRENIVFDHEFDEEKYKRVIKACAMETDLKMFVNGDETLVGERGVALSGGQRARINLARAVYFDADIVLLDDPLSAVDTHVGRQLFDECICGLLKDRICILVTHQLQYLKGATSIMCLHEGQCVGQGTYFELRENGLDVMSLVSTMSGDHENQVNPEGITLHTTYKPDKPVYPSNGYVCLRHDAPRSNAGNSTTDNEVVWKRRSALSLSTTMSMETLAEPPEEVLANKPEAEEQHTGTVTWKVYMGYCRAGAGPIVRLVIVLLLLGSQNTIINGISQTSLSRFLHGERTSAHRADSEEHRVFLAENYRNSNSTTSPSGYLSRNTYIWVYGGLVVTGFVSNLVCAIMLFSFFVTASQNLHNDMFNRIVKAPIYFFDTNPVGRVLNRFAKDISQMDDILANALYDFIRLSLLTFSILLLNVASMPYLLIAAVPMTFLFGYIRNYYLKTSREIKRLEAINRSPVYSHLSTSLTGLMTIRAFKAEDKFVDSYDAYQDFHSASYFLFLTTQRWLGVRLDMICATFFAFATFLSVLIVESGLVISASVVGLSLIYAKQLTGMFQWCIRQSAEVENNMTSVERVVEYAHIEQEEETSKPLEPPADWPTYGIITAERLYYAHHKSLPPVLKNLNFCIRAEEKVGIVGRTGAGKSSLLAVLFRLNNPDGLVRIDTLPITDLRLHDLRSVLSIIPQDPVLFSGTLRKNLDPFVQYSDGALWDALEEVQLREAVEALPDGLEFQLAESGSNFSVGQRQLICLARAILSHNKILVIDEATANVDQSTDTLIQETIRQKFVDCTVLTIAHRLNTIMDSDRVMVLEEGRLVEFDEPHVLLLNPRGVFTQLVQQTGSKTAAKLREEARQAFELRHDCDGEDIMEDYRKFHDESTTTGTEVDSGDDDVRFGNRKRKSMEAAERLSSPDEGSDGDSDTPFIETRI